MVQVRSSFSFTISNSFAETPALFRFVQLVETTGASITNKGTFYEPGKEPGPGELPKLHFLIESNDESKVKHAISEIKRSLVEGATMAIEAEQRAGAGGAGGAATGRYSLM